MDKTEIRMKNFPSEFPFKQTLVHTVDSGDYVAGLEKLNRCRLCWICCKKKTIRG